MNYGNLNIGTFLEKSAKAYPNVECVVTEGRRFTYCEFDEVVNQLAHFLLNSGVSKGDRIAFLFYNQWEALASYFAITRIGAIVVPINYRLVKEEMQYQINNSEARSVLFDSSFQDIVEDMLKGLTTVKDFICSGCGYLNNWCKSLEDSLSKQPKYLPVLKWKVQESDISGIVYTSGTTGLPKGAVITHYSSIWSGVIFALENQFSRGMRFLQCVPLFHRAGLEDLALSVIIVGGTVLLLRTFDAAKVLDTIQNESVTHSLIVPTMSNLVLAELKKNPNRYCFPCFSGYLTGTAPWPEKTMRELRQYLPSSTRQSNLYGITEALFITCAHQEDLDRKPGTAGKPVIGAQMKILDDKRKQVAPGNVGEIVVKEPQQMQGYWRNPNATEEATFDENWYLSGDVGYVDEEGYLFILDRKKDMIITGSENVYSVEVENALKTNLKIDEVAVIGIPDEKWGEAVAAVVVLRPGADADEEEIIEYCKGKIASYKKPRKVFFAASLPKSPAGKLQKNKLRQKLAKSDQSL